MFLIRAFINQINMYTFCIHSLIHLHSFIFFLLLQVPLFILLLVLLLLPLVPLFILLLALLLLLLPYSNLPVSFIEATHC